MRRRAVALPDRAPVPEVAGSTMPRLFTPPLVTGVPGPCGCGCALTPDTSYGFLVDRFAREVLRLPLDPWQRWLVIHGGELLPDGRPRFRKLLIIVARQNGKTHLLIILTLFWLFVQKWKLVIGQSTMLATAKEAWEAAQEIAQDNPWLSAEFGTVRRDNNDPHWRVAGGGKYRVAAAGRRGGRGSSVDRAVVDELREHQTWVAHDALMPAMNARPHAQAWLISNQGDDRSVVLNSYRKRAILASLAALEALGLPALEPEFREAIAKRNAIARGAATADPDEEELDDEIGLFEWSARPGASADDPMALAAANPNAGRRVRMKSLVADARAALRAGGDQETGFRTEILCQRVAALDAAIDVAGWEDCRQPGTLDELRGNLAACIDVAPDQQHVTLSVAAQMPDGRVRGEVVGSWVSTKAARAELPELLRRIRARKVGWFPNGPAASLAADLAGVARAEEISGEVSAACMGLADMVLSREFLHSGQELLDMHALSAAKLWKGETWRFSRKGEGHCDAVYAMAGAVHLARTLPPSAGRPRLIVSTK